ncbi:MAG: ribosomal L7Ae/L30e/S12e/Gadd45 family protein [Clostridia bacterium]|nr:ribosomal L7Ae/L30e/S12e/Gadd45 family protein [Clostridia bacterium]
MNETAIKRATSSIGLAKKAGKIICGIPMIIEALRTAKKPSLVIASAEASANSLKKISDKCKFYGVEIITIPISPDELAHSVGNSGSVAAVSINDGGLADLVRSALDESKNLRS